MSPAAVKLNPFHQARTRRISDLLPLVSSMRYSSDREARRKGMLLQTVLRDLERLNDIELYCERADIDSGELIELLRKP